MSLEQTPYRRNDIEMAAEVARIQTHLEATDQRLEDHIQRMEKSLESWSNTMTGWAQALHTQALEAANSLAAVAAETAAKLNDLALSRANELGASTMRRKQMSWVLGILATVCSSAITALIIRGVR